MRAIQFQDVKLPADSTWWFNHDA